ncbi:unnamed protein product [Brassica rapa]|uniref:Uncharacterized protein n=1 Tax=Brassica campestris TaxID=3711 RepID=A0A8D9FYY1_BRACM|nr:unnamed protein product [Brassica rapa]
MAVHQYTYKHVCPWTQHADPSRGLFGSHFSTLVLGLRTLALPVDCLGDFGPRGLSVQYTQDVCGCPPGHTGRPWLSVCVCGTCVCVCVCPSAHTGSLWLTHRTSVAVHQYTYQHHVGPWTQHTGPSRGLFGTHRTSVGVRQHTQDVCGCQWLYVSTHRTFMAVRVCPCVSVGVCQHTQDVLGCPWLSVSTHRTSMCVHQQTQDVCVRVCPSAYTGCPWLSISTHISTLALPVDWSGDFGPRGLSVQYTKDVRGCPSAHTGRQWHTQDVRVCLCVSVSTHRTSVAVHQYTYQHVGPWTQHAGPSRGLFGTQRTSVGVRQHTQDVRGCLWLSVSTHRTSVTVRVCPSAHTGGPWVSVSTHRTSVCVRRHTQDVRG